MPTFIVQSIYTATVNKKHGVAGAPAADYLEKAMMNWVDLRLRLIHLL